MMKGGTRKITKRIALLLILSILGNSVSVFPIESKAQSVEKKDEGKKLEEVSPIENNTQERDFLSYEMDSEKQYYLSVNKEDGQKEVTELFIEGFDFIVERLLSIDKTYEKWKNIIKYQKTLREVDFTLEADDEEKVMEKRLTIEGSMNDRLNGNHLARLEKCVENNACYYMLTLEQNGTVNKYKIYAENRTTYIVGKNSGEEQKIVVQQDKVEIYVQDELIMQLIKKNGGKFEFNVKKDTVTEKGLTVLVVSEKPITTPEPTPGETTSPEPTPTVIPDVTPSEIPTVTVTPVQTPFITQLPEETKKPSEQQSSLEIVGKNRVLLYAYTTVKTNAKKGVFVPKALMEYKVQVKYDKSKYQIKYVSSNAKSVSVGKTGVIRGIKMGSSKISVQLYSKSDTKKLLVQKTIAVTVKPFVYMKHLNGKKYVVNRGKTYKKKHAVQFKIVGVTGSYYLFFKVGKQKYAIYTGKKWKGKSIPKKNKTWIPLSGKKYRFFVCTNKKGKETSLESSNIVKWNI